MVVKSVRTGKSSGYDIAIFHFGKFFLIRLDGIFIRPYCPAIARGEADEGQTDDRL
ncbi:hypothetical protein MESS2_650003 [Mesorhizobium metallidurans STM 2683]|uniref:Uncharacterized protein n=1 Tax=Mesorhizobium metallidurans STM 2683 TaxID=1297569 RepID=M5EV21_9HYPH|nr:hypothetical protein [Mesorhizobium metallidurans]CCV07778.1 hypothetical protein MESS2_650003 [Mesorhizobium metallidurans STM 2683]